MQKSKGFTYFFFDAVVHYFTFLAWACSNLLHYSPVDENGGVLGPPFLVVHNHLLRLGYVVVLAPHGQVSDLFIIGCLVVVGDQA